MGDGKVLGRSAALIAAVLFGIVLWHNATQVADPDVWWHLKAGELIWRARAVPRVDPFSYTIAGRPWVDFEWLSQLIFYAIYSFAGLHGLTAFKALVVAGTALVFFRLGRSGLWAGLLLCAASYASGSLAERPMIFDGLFLSLALGFIDRASDARPPWARLILLSALWSNLHGGAALLGAGVVAAKAASFWLGGKKRPFRVWALASAACAAAAAIHPCGLRIYSNLYENLTFPGRELIAEWNPLHPLTFMHALFFAGAAATYAFSWSEDPVLGAAMLGLGAMAATAARWVPLFELVAASAAARCLERRLPARPGPAAVVIMTTAALVMGARTPATGLSAPPEGPIRFLEREGISGRMFNDYDAGGYLIWRTFPGRRVFVDGRNVEYGADFITQALRWREPEVWAGLDEKWRFDYALLSRAGSLRARPLNSSPDWILAYSDPSGAVYVRSGPLSKKIVRTADSIDKK